MKTEATSPRLPPLVPRPGYCGGAGIHMDHVIWIRTHAITRVEPAPMREGGYPQIRLFSGDEYIDTHGGSIEVGMSKTFSGEDTCVYLSAYARRDIDRVLEWERDNPNERRLNQSQYDMSAIGEEISNQVLMGPEGHELLNEIDRALGRGAQTDQIVSLRRELRKGGVDPQEAASSMLTKVLALA